MGGKGALNNVIISKGKTSIPRAPKEGLAALTIAEGLFFSF